MGVLKVREDRGRRVPREGLDAPDLDAGGPEVLRSAAAERVSAPEGFRVDAADRELEEFGRTQ
eukprot:7735907-Alexandrium_andersonii.AAC.1